MKKTTMATVVVVGLGAVCGAAFLMKGHREPPATRINSETAADATADTIAGPLQTDAQATAKRRLPSARSVAAPARSAGPTSPSQAGVAPSALADPGRVTQLTFNQAIESLVSRQASHAQKEAAWKHLREAGKLDQAIGELEQRTASNPGAAEFPAALGQAYLQKCGMIQDVREQGILAMKADQVFDAALNLDANNPEARFTKAVAMSYWPTQMNRGTEVMQHFVTLVEQQEAQAPQPQFAQTYVWLGKEYEKYGHAAEAREVWQRGAALHPNDQELRARLGTP